MGIDTIKSARELIQAEQEVGNIINIATQQSTENDLVYHVKSQSKEDHYYKVEFSRYNHLQCNCEYGIRHGYKGNLCKHAVAVLLFTTENLEKIAVIQDRL